MRVRLTFAVVAFLLVALPASAASVEPWRFDGGGWGHGVGLSQYGSQAMALDGSDVAEIIDFYYSGADVEPLAGGGVEAWVDDPDAIWVGLASNLTTRSFVAVGDGITVCQTGDGSDDCSATDLTLTNGDVLAIKVVGTSPLVCERTVNGAGPVTGDCWFDIDLLDGDTSVRLRQGGQDYARGKMRIRPNAAGAEADHTLGTKFHVVVSLQLEHYIYGIAETLLWWEPAALQTQAVIARSYAVRKAMDRADSNGVLPGSRKASCWCHLVSSTADQNYDGWDTDNEGSATYGAKWRSAVDGTAGMIVTHPQVGGGNEVITTFYSSSNGGASEDNEDVWGGAALPYLRSVDDPWSVTPANPLAHWTVLVTDVEMASAFGWDRVLDAFILEGPPGLVVEFTGWDNGGPVSAIRNGTQIRSLLNAHGFLDGGGAVRTSPYISMIVDPPGFDDIIGNTFEADIEWAALVGVTKGCNPPDNTLFCPNDSVTRGQMAAFLNRYLDLPPASKDYFSDDNGTTFESDINRLAEAGITKGCNPPANDKFCPKATVDRGQMAAFLVRAFGLTAGLGADLFVDDNGSTFEADIDRLGTAGVTKGCNPPKNDRYCPGQPVSRGAMAAFLHRADGL